MNRRCACGEHIPYSRTLCSECLEIYGVNRDEWPAWLDFAVADEQRKINYRRNHDELEYDDEILYPGNSTHVIKGQHYSPTMGWGSYSDVD